MDHLLLPKHPSIERVRVPLLCNRSSPYDNGEFTTYPTRAGWPELLPANRQSLFWLSGQSDSIDDEEMRRQEIIVQSWLFFGHLHALLFPFDLYSSGDYIDEDTSGRLWLHTRKLEDRLGHWHQKVAELDVESKQIFLEQAKQRYSLSAEATIMLRNESYATFNRMVKLSILAMCALVEGVILRAIDGSIHSLNPSVGVQYDEAVRQTMLSNGWCPSDITLVAKSTSHGPAALWYLMHMSRTDSPSLHTQCTEISCSRMQIDLADYSIRHVNDTCKCPSVGPDMLELMACLREGEIPILEVSGNAQELTEIRVHRLGGLPQDTSYVALSHVWADGLGNPFENKLPSCQLQRLKGYITKLGTSKDTYEYGIDFEPFKHKTKFYLWCDTLCCPVELEGKKMVLPKMRDIYLNAAFVLVLDQELASYNSEDIGMLEASWRLLTSRYARRLWTFQEAGLAVKLVVQFADTAVDVLAMIRQNALTFNQNYMKDRLYVHIAATFMNWRQWTRSDSRYIELKEAVAALATRTVSVSTDEPLCLSTVLGIESSHLAQVEPAQRMRMLWQTIARSQRQVSSSIIFHTLPRLDEPGVRWAPKSVLQPADRDTDIVELGSKESGVLMAQGLKVRCPGWRIRRADLPSNVTDAFWPETAVMATYAPALHRDGSCYNAMQMPDQGLVTNGERLLDLLADRQKEWYILLHKDEHVWSWQRWFSQRKGLLVSKEENELGLTYYRSHMIVFIDRVEPVLEVARQVDYLWDRWIRSSWALTTLKLVSTYETVGDYLLSWTPKFYRSFVTTLATPPLVWCGKNLGLRLRAMMIQTKTMAPQLPAAAKILKQAGDEAAKNVGATIIKIVMGRYIHIEETFDASTEWVVD